MRLPHAISMEDIVICCLCGFVILLGLAITRVGLYGEHLGGFKLVSYVKKHVERPRWHHRFVTMGIGIASILLGVALLVFFWLHVKAADPN